MSGRSYRALFVWQKAKSACVELYRVTQKFPKEERYGLTSQIRRSAVSIPSNIAEGRYRGTKKEFKKFLRYAFASGAELETQITIAYEIGYLAKDEHDAIQLRVSEIMKMLNALIDVQDSSISF